MARIKSKSFVGVYYEELQNKDKSYYITYKYDGKKIWTKIGLYSEGIRENYCKAKRDEAIHKARLGETPPDISRKAKAKNKLDFREVWLFFANNKTMKEKRREELRGKYEEFSQSYKGGVWDKHLNEYFQAGVTEEKLKRFYHNKKNELAMKTINMRITELGTAINYWNDEKKENLIDEVTTFKRWLKNNEPIEDKENKKIERIRFLSVEEVQLLKDAIKDKDKDLTLFVAIALSTGARLGSILTIKKIDIQGRQVSIINHKRGGRIYNGFLNDECLQLINEKIEKMKINDTFFTLKRRQIQRRLQWILDKLFNKGLDTKDSQNRVVIHTLRHSFASRLVMNGTALIKVRDLLDHKEIKTTERYAHLAPDAGLDDVMDMWSKA